MQGAYLGCVRILTVPALCPSPIDTWHANLHESGLPFSFFCSAAVRFPSNSMPSVTWEKRSQTLIFYCSIKHNDIKNVSSAGLRGSQRQNTQ